jgi:tetratricopeptide (TPR) repeat protein
MVDSDPHPVALRRIVRALMLGALVATAAAHADDMQDANALLKARRYPEALKLVDKVIAAKPGNPQARFLKGLILTEQGDSKGAIQVFQKLTKDYPDLPEPYNNLAVIYASEGEYEKARIELERSIRTHSSYATAYENLGDVYARLASQAYDKALQLDSSNSTAQSKLMLVRSLVGPTSLSGASAEGKVAKSVEVAAAPQHAPAPPAASPNRPVPPAAPPKAPAPPAAPPIEPAPPAAQPAPAPKATSAPPVVAAADKLPAKEPAPNSAADVRREVLEAVDAWASAWSNRNADAYLAHYAPDFKTPHGEPRSAWEKQRRSRVTGPKSISVEIKSPKVTRESANRARVTFQQTYRSDRFSGSTDKTLEMVKIDGRWLIRQEKVGG